MTVLHREPLTAIRVCEACGQPLRTQRGGIFMSPLKAAIWDLIAASGDVGASVGDIMRLPVWHRRKPVKPVTIRMHVLQLNDALADTAFRIVSIDRRYVIARIANGDGV